MPAIWLQPVLRRHEGEGWAIKGVIMVVADPRLVLVSPGQGI